MEANPSAVERYVRSLEGDYFLQTEVAHALNCSRRLLGKLHNENAEQLGPSFAIDFAGQRVFLYTEEDVERIREHLLVRQDYLATDASADGPGKPGKSLNRSGRPALFTPEEALERQNRHSKAGYWKAQADKYRSRRQFELADAAQARADVIRAGLRAEHEARAAAGGRASVASEENAAPQLVVS